MVTNTTTRFDLTDQRDVIRLVNVFYDRIRADDLLAPIFDDVARVDWTEHLPRMYDFWASVLLSAGTFHGNPLLAHRTLSKMVPLGGRMFARWLLLFHQTVDDLFVGPMAEHAKLSATRISYTLERAVRRVA